MTYLLDTSVLVNFLRGSSIAKDLLMKLSHSGSFAVSVITYGELVYGAHRSGAFARERKVLLNFINDFRIAVLPLTVATLELFAAAKYVLERKGTKLDDFDLLIGATAVASQSTLVTDNLRHLQDLRKIPGIGVL